MNADTARLYYDRISTIVFRKLVNTPEQFDKIIDEALSDQMLFRAAVECGEYQLDESATFLDWFTNICRLVVIKSEVSRTRLERKMEHYFCQFMLIQPDPAEVIKALTEEPSILTDVRATFVTFERWTERVNHTIAVWQQWVEQIPASFPKVKQMAEDIWMRELRRAERLILMDDPIDAVFRFLTIEGVRDITRFVYSWSDDFHSEAIRIWLCQEVKTRKKPLFCGTCWSSTPKTSRSGFCPRCHLIFYCSRECQSQHWKKHQLVCGKHKM